MYIDPNTGGMLFQVLAVILAFISGAILLFSSKIRAGVARMQRFIRKDEPEKPSEQAQPTAHQAEYTREEESSR